MFSKPLGELGGRLYTGLIFWRLFTIFKPEVRALLDWEFRN